MRRSAGLAGIERRERLETSYRTLGQEISLAQVAQLEKTVSAFQEHLRHFAARYKKRIKADAAFRDAFLDLCSTLGVDPLGSSKTLWSALGVGTFYYEIAIQTLDLCRASRDLDGGLCALPDVVRRLKRIRGEDADLTESDLVRACKTLRPLGGGNEIISIGQVKYLRTLPAEMNGDVDLVLAFAASQPSRGVSVTDLVVSMSWKADRARVAMDLLVASSLAWIDRPSEASELYYWIPAISLHGS